MKGLIALSSNIKFLEQMVLNCSRGSIKRGLKRAIFHDFRKKYFKNPKSGTILARRLWVSLNCLEMEL